MREKRDGEMGFIQVLAFLTNTEYVGVLDEPGMVSLRILLSPRELSLPGSPSLLPKLWTCDMMGFLHIQCILYQWRRKMIQ